MDTTPLIPDARLADLVLVKAVHFAVARAALHALAGTGLAVQGVEAALRAVVRRPHQYSRRTPWEALAAALLSAQPEGPGGAAGWDRPPRPAAPARGVTPVIRPHRPSGRRPGRDQPHRAGLYGRLAIAVKRTLAVWSAVGQGADGG